jgi:hypothetical protein
MQRLPNSNLFLGRFDKLKRNRFGITEEIFF